MVPDGAATCTAMNRTGWSTGRPRSSTSPCDSTKRPLPSVATSGEIRRRQLAGLLTMGNVPVPGGRGHGQALAAQGQLL